MCYEALLNRAIKVIDSCCTLEQAQVAARYLTLVAYRCHRDGVLKIFPVKPLTRRLADKVDVLARS